MRDRDFIPDFNPAQLDQNAYRLSLLLVARNALGEEENHKARIYLDILERSLRLDISPSNCRVAEVVANEVLPRDAAAA